MSLSCDPGRIDISRRAGPFAARGFTMIKVLVTLVIMMFGLLGFAGLILKGQKGSFEAYQRHQALILAIDMTEKVNTNRLSNGQIDDATAVVVPTACTRVSAILRPTGWL